MVFSTLGTLDICTPRPRRRSGKALGPPPAGGSHAGAVETNAPPEDAPTAKRGSPTQRSRRATSASARATGGASAARQQREPSLSPLETATTASLRASAARAHAASSGRSAPATKTSRALCEQPWAMNTTAAGRSAKGDAQPARKSDRGGRGCGGVCARAWVRGCVRVRASALHAHNPASDRVRQDGDGRERTQSPQCRTRQCHHGPIEARAARSAESSPASRPLPPTSCSNVYAASASAAP